MNRPIVARRFPGTRLVVAFLALCAALWAQPSIRAHYFPVGQAHSTLLEFSCGAALIDAGAQDKETADLLVEYLNSFFEDRPDLNKTLDLVLITHNHIDHNFALKAIATSGVTIKNYVDDGILAGKGGPAAKWIRANAHTEGRNISIRDVKYAEIEKLPGRSGLTDERIDPINCNKPGEVDPQIRVLSGRVMKRPAGWTAKAFGNANNHSLVTRIDFGAASFLFMGDLEEPGIDYLLEHYTGQSAKILDADVLQVGHHGSHNATKKELLDAVTPRIAVIPVGAWDFGKGSGDPFTTNAYGHPRRVALDLLQDNMDEKRSEPIKVMAASAARTFRSYTVRKRIYATGWDGLVKVMATAEATYRVTRAVP